MAEQLVFRPREADISTALLQKLARILDEVDGRAFDDVSRDGQDVFEDAAEELRTVRIDADDNISDEENINRLLDVGNALQMALLYADYQQDSLQVELDELQAEMSKREDSDPVRLLQEVNDLQNDKRELERKLTESRKDLESANREIAETNDKTKKEREQSEDLQKRVKDLEGKLEEKNEQIRDMQSERDDLRKSQEDFMGADEMSKKREREINRLRNEVSRYQRNEKDLRRRQDEMNKEYNKLRNENDEDKRHLVKLDEMYNEIFKEKAELESRVEDLIEDRDNLRMHSESEREEMLMRLDELEERFQRQYANWEQEREAYEAQIEALQQGGPLDHSSHYTPSKHNILDETIRSTRQGSAVADDPNASTDALREEIMNLREEQVLLMEAYEQLENDLGAEIDKALDEQAGKIEEAGGKLKVTEEELEGQYEVVKQLQKQILELQSRAEEAEEQAEKFLSGNFGLSDAVRDAKLLKEQLRAEQQRLEEKVEEVNNYASKMEELIEENEWLKRKAGLPEDMKIDLSELRLARHGQMMQLKSMNALLEEENMRLEEDVRRLKHELRFRTKWEGMSAAGLGLTPEQLQLLELKAEQIKFGYVDSRDEELLRLHKRIQYLEGRLAEAQAYADLPEDKRGLIDEEALSGRKVAETEAGQSISTNPSLLKAVANALDDMESVAKILPARHAEIRELVDQARETLQEAYDKEKKAAQAYSLPAEGAARESRTSARPTTAAERDSRFAGSRAWNALTPDVLADAQADKLREKLRQMASQLAELHGIAEHKNALLEASEREKAELARRLRGVGAGAGDSDSAMVTREEYDEVRQEADSLRVQLIECLEEQSLKEQEIAAMARDMDKYRERFQGFEDQKRLLYREYVREMQQWRAERSRLEQQVDRLKADCDEAKAATEEYKRGLEAIQRSTSEEVRVQYGDAVRRMALASMRSARLSRELSCSAASEKHLLQEKAELESEMTDMGSTLRTRMRYLERGKQAAEQRIERLYRELEVSVPCKAYEMLVEKYGALQRSTRQKLQDSADSIMKEEEIVALRDEAAEMTTQIFSLVEECGRLKEHKRKSEQRLRELSTTEHGASIGLGFSASIRHTDSSVIPKEPSSTGQNEDVGELVKLRVDEANARKRAELEARKAERVSESESELKARLQEVEKQLSDSAAELYASQQSNKLYQDRLEGALSRKEATALTEELEMLKSGLSKAQGSVEEWKQRARELEENATREKRTNTLQLATITQLRTALREIAASNDAKAALGKLHEEINHVRSKEACVRNQLIRSEQERSKLQDENSSLRRDLAQRDSGIARLQDAAHFASRERQELLGQLQAAMQGRVEAWRAERWRRKLEDIKGRNDFLAGNLDDARRRILRLEERAERAELEREAVTSLEEILSRPAAEAFKQCAHLTEQSLHQRLETSKVRRELSLQTEKVRYFERVNSELEARLEEYEAEAFRNQTSLEAEKTELLTKIRSLEERILSGGTADGGEPHPQHEPLGHEPGLVRASAQALESHRQRVQHLRQHGRETEDREALLEQVETVRQLKQELADSKLELQSTSELLAEVRHAHNSLRIEYDDLVEQMARERELRLASDEALSALERRQHTDTDKVMGQVRAAAEQRISKLEQRLQERTAELEAAKKRADGLRQQYLEQHERDREEIERLNQTLFENNESKIEAIRDNIKGTRAINAINDETDRSMTYDQLQRLLDERDGQLEQVRNQREQLQRQNELADRHHREEVEQKDQAIQELTAELNEFKRTNTDLQDRRQEVNKLRRELSEKASLLRELKTALKNMEERMIKSERDQVEDTMKTVSFKEREQQDERIMQLEKEKARFEKQLQEARIEADDLKQRLRDQAQQHGSASEELQRLQTKLDEAQRDLTRERRKVRELKNQRDTAGTLNTALKKPDPKVAGTLENRVKVLEAQNARLRAAVQQERGPLEREAAQQVADEQALDRTARTAPRPPSGEGPRDHHGKGDEDSRPEMAGSKGGSRSDYRGADPRVKQWEENKKLKDRLQKMRDAVQAKSKALEEQSREQERRSAQVAGLQEELRRAKELLAEAQRSGGAGARGGEPRPPLSEPQKMRELVAEANAVIEERDQLAKELSALRQQTGSRRGRAAGDGLHGSELGTEGETDPQVELYELRLERDQAQAQVARLKSQLYELFGEQTAGSGHAAQRTGRGASSRKGSTAREAELEATVDALQRALDRASREAKQSVPNTKYVALLEKKKQQAKELASLQNACQAGEKAKQELKAIELRCASLEETNAALRTQLKEARAAATAGEDEGNLADKLRAAQAALQSKENQLYNMQARLREMTASSSGSAEVANLQRKLEELEAENEDLKSELNAFDPAFFEEIEDLKHEHCQLGIKVQQYERIIQDQSRQLGVSPPW